jgi:hypothetical protein
MEVMKAIIALRNGQIKDPDQIFSLSFLIIAVIL